MAPSWQMKSLWQKANAQKNPLLEQAINAIGQQGDTKETDAISKEMEAKIRQNTEEAKFDPNTKLIGKLTDKMLVLEQTLYGALGREADRLNGLVVQQDFYQSVLDGTVDTSTAMNFHGFYNYGDTEQYNEQFQFMDFESYLDTNGYERKNFNPFDANFTSFESNIVHVEGERYGYALMEEDKVPYYEKWKEEKQAFQLEALKQYATEKLPQLQSQIEDAPNRIASIYAQYSIAKMELLSQLPEGFDAEDFKATKTDDLFGEAGSAGRTDGKVMLDLLKQILSKQQALIKDLGGAANDVNYFTNLKPNFGKVPLDKLNMKV